MTNSAEKEHIVTEIERWRVSAILRTKDQQIARDAMNAAVRGGFRMIEFTLTTPGACELVSEFSTNTELLVGAGTVLTVEQARNAVSAGAKFLVSPICDPAVIEEAANLGAVAIPGALTPTEMMTAHRSGADFVKLFPAPADVPEYVTAVLGPLPFLRIFPTAGVTLENFNDVLAAGAKGVGFVRSLFDPADMSAQNFDAIEGRAARIIKRLSAEGVRS